MPSAADKTNTSDPKPPESPSPNLSTQLCSSCDGCRTRKTKCDGQTPCAACVQKYVKKHQVPKEQVTAKDCECTYSIAKRRGPQPGFKTRKKIDDGELYAKKKKKKKEKVNNTHMGNSNFVGNGLPGNIPLPLDPGAAALQQQILSGLGAIGLGLYANFAGHANQFNMNQNCGDAMAAASNSARQQLGIIERLQRQQQEMQMQNQMNQDGGMSLSGEWHMDGRSAGSMPHINPGRVTNREVSQKLHQAVGCEKTAVLELLPILLPNDQMGTRFRASYTLSFGSMFHLPPILTCEEYCGQFADSSMPKYDVAALQAAQFAELAIGAMVDGNQHKMFQLANASILCLQDSAKEPIHPSALFELARAYFLHALLRSYNGDMDRYFKYRRSAMNTLSKLDDHQVVESLMASISFQDTLAYMLYDGSEDDVHDIDFEYPQVISSPGKAKADSGVMLPSKLSSDPNNKTWITCPLGFSTENDPTLRLLDALSCATRSFVDASKVAAGSNAKDKGAKFDSCMSHLLEEITLNGHIGHKMLAKALQISKNELSYDDLNDSCPEDALDVLKAVIQQPLLLYQGGCTYQLVHKCALFTAQYINKLNKEDSDSLDDALDIYNASRVVLNMHTNHLPVHLKCSTIPNLSSADTLIEIKKEPKHDMSKVVPTNSSALDIVKELDINDKSFLVLLSGCF